MTALKPYGGLLRGFEQNITFVDMETGQDIKETEVERKKYDFDRVVRLVLTVIVVLGAIYVINYLSSVLLPFFVGCLLAYMLDPVNKFLMRVLHVKNRAIPAIITMLLFLGAIYLIFRFLVPYFIDEFTDMGKLLSNYAQHEFHFNGIPLEIQHYFDQYLDAHALNRLFSGEQWTKIANNLMKGTWTVVDSTLSAIVTVISWLLALLYMFFVMMDYDKISRAFKSSFPPKYRKTAIRIFGDVTNTMSRYFRSQALVSLFVGIIFAIEFQIIGLPMAIVFGLSIGVLNMVPYLQLISIPVAAFLCIVQSVATGCAFWPLFGWTFLAYCICQVIQDLVLIPTIMKQQMGLRPAIVFLALSIWGYVLGFIGLIIALPLTTLIISYYSEFVLHAPNPLHKQQQPNSKKKQ